MDDVGNWAPLRNIGTLKRNELRGLVKHFAFANDELMQRENVHQLIVRTSLLIEFGMII